MPLSERVIALLSNIQLEQLGQTEGWVFPSKKSTSGHIGLSGIENAFRKLARKLGTPDALKLYCARHTFGTVAMAETRNPGLVKEVMGHESLDTTMGYYAQKGDMYSECPSLLISKACASVDST